MFAHSVAFCHVDNRKGSPWLRPQDLESNNATEHAQSEVQLRVQSADRLASPVAASSYLFGFENRHFNYLWAYL